MTQCQPETLEGVITMTTVTLEFNMAEINNIRKAIMTKLTVVERNKRDVKNALASGLPMALKCALHEELREYNNTLDELRILEHKIDAFVCNQTGEDM